ncbi:Mitochondrial GTPase 1, partial [Stegodyphus mimosarum]
MIKIPFRCMSTFRQKFECNLHNFTSWFPGHMYKGLLQMQAKLATVDCIIEVHDARIPFSGRNPTFYSTLYAIKPHILVLNKSDLADLSHINDIKQGLLQENIHHVLFASCKGGSKSGINKIIPLVTELIKDTDFYNRGNTSSFTLMVIGIPNVGKSSLINRLRNLHLKRKSATSVGAEPGVTRSVLEKIKPPFVLGRKGDMKQFCLQD